MKPARSRANGCERVSWDRYAKLKYHPLGGGSLNSIATPPLASPFIFFAQRAERVAQTESYIRGLNAFALRLAGAA
jgi:hypothetical protein